MKIILMLFLLVLPALALADDPSVKDYEIKLRLILERKQVAQSEFERGKILVDHGSAIMQDSQRSFNKLMGEENRDRQKLLELRNKEKPKE